MRKHISIIVPVRNQNEFLRPFYYDLLKHIGSLDYEIIWVNNASTDSSFEEIKDLMNKDCSIRCITLKNETSSRAAVISGLDYAKGEFIVVMRGDLQHPGSMIPEILNMLEKGSDIVNMRPENSMKAPGIKRMIFDFVYQFNPKINTEPVTDISDFRGFRKEVVTDILFIQKHHFFMEEFFNWNEYKSTELNYFNRRYAKHLHKYSNANLLYNLKIIRDQASPGQLRKFAFAGKATFALSVFSIFSFIMMDLYNLNVHPIYYSIAIIIGILGLQLLILSNYKRKLKEDLFYCSRSNQYLVDNIYDSSEPVEVANLIKEENKIRIRKVS